MKLTAQEIAWSRSGPEMDFASGSTGQYSVGGLPVGQEAYIAKFNDSWRILHSDDQRGWRGDYASAEEALEALESELSG